MKAWTLQSEYLIRGGKWTPLHDHDTYQTKPELSHWDLVDRWYDYLSVYHELVGEGVYDHDLPDYYRLALYEADTETGETNLIESFSLASEEYA